uniref:BZIP domain-containing protein n=1 Tax=Monopterus albus TaxID=43700 RepID=A0A3Q3J0R4_MONAL|nr:uncharacterized protein LOC109974188 [Monopterus albus]XP_020479921.1 uncharacterized protein LOC109974188 [Monopterus albus]
MSTPTTRDGSGAAASCRPSSSVDSSSYMESDPDRGLLFPVVRPSVVTRRVLRLRASSSYESPVTRRKRKMIPADRKDSAYWEKRHKNNEAAKRSREKRRLNDLMLEDRLLAVSEENVQLRAQVLSLQYHISLREEKSKAARACATSTPPFVASSTLSSPRPVHSPALCQTGLWGNSKINPASILGVRDQGTVSPPFEVKIPWFGSTRCAGGFNPQSPQNCGTQKSILPLSGLCVLTPRATLEGGRSAEGEMDVLRQISSSDDIPISTSRPIRALLQPPDALHHASTLPYPAQSWLVPHLNHSAVCNNLLLPWRSSCLAPSAVYPGLPLYMQERKGQDLGVEADTERIFKSQFSSVPPGPPQQEMHLGPDRC